MAFFDFLIPSSIALTNAQESVAGVTLSRTYKPTINAKEYPTPNTRPLNPTVAPPAMSIVCTNLEQDMDLLELEDDPNFWDMYIDDSDEQSIPMKDLTKQPCDATFHYNLARTNTTVTARNKVQPESSRKPTRMPTPSIPYYSPNKPKKRPNGTYEYGPASFHI
jgi:ATP-dependent DNA helicase HFM1/MER3